MGRFQIGFKWLNAFCLRQNSKDSSALIIDQYNAEIIWRVILPKRIDVIKEAQITCDKYCGLRVSHCRSHSSTGTSFYSTGPSIAKNLVGGIGWKQLSISNACAVGNLKLNVIR